MGMGRRTLAWTWIVLVLVVCWIPRANVPREEALPSGLRIPHLDKWIHATLFAGYALCWSAVPGGRRATLVRVIGGGLLLAFGTEWVQGHPWIGRTTDVADAGADLVGLFAGLLAAEASGISRRAVVPSAGP